MRVLLKTADNFVLGRVWAEDLPMIAAEALTRRRLHQRQLFRAGRTPQRHGFFLAVHDFSYSSRAVPRAIRYRSHRGACLRAVA